MNIARDLAPFGSPAPGRSEPASNGGAGSGGICCPISDSRTDDGPVPRDAVGARVKPVSPPGECRDSPRQSAIPEDSSMQLHPPLTREGQSPVRRRIASDRPIAVTGAAMNASGQTVPTSGRRGVGRRRGTLRSHAPTSPRVAADPAGTRAADPRPARHAQAGPGEDLRGSGSFGINGARGGCSPRDEPVAMDGPSHRAAPYRHP